MWPAKLCSCQFGDGATGMSCPVDNMVSCVSCLPQYSLKGRKCVVQRTTTTARLRPATTEVTQTTTPPIRTVVGVFVPSALVFIVILAALIMCVCCVRRSTARGEVDYRILVTVPQTAQLCIGNKLDHLGRLILYTTPRCTIGRVAEKIHAALDNVPDPSQMCLQLDPGAGKQVPLLPGNKGLPHDQCLKQLGIPVDSVFMLVGGATSTKIRNLSIADPENAHRDSKGAVSTSSSDSDGGMI